MPKQEVGFHIRRYVQPLEADVPPVPGCVEVYVRVYPIPERYAPALSAVMQAAAARYLQVAGLGGGTIVELPVEGSDKPQ